MARKIVAVAFDLDGLMVNTEELFLEVARRMVQKRGLQLDMNLIRQMMGRPSRVAIPLMIEHYDLSESVGELESETFSILDGLLDDRLAPMPGLEALIGHLDSLSIPKAITSSSRRAFVDRVLKLLQIPTEFEFFLTAEDVKEGKPNPEIYQRAAAGFGIPPEKMMVLEDSELGCRAAVRANAFAVAVPGEHSCGHQYDGASLVVDSLADERIKDAFTQSS